MLSLNDKSRILFLALLTLNNMKRERNDLAWKEDECLGRWKKQLLSRMDMESIKGMNICLNNLYA